MFPHMERSGHKPNTRELPVRSYVIADRVTESFIETSAHLAQCASAAGEVRRVAGIFSTSSAAVRVALRLLPRSGHQTNVWTIIVGY
jgi:hypothetical protein